MSGVWLFYAIAALGLCALVLRARPWTRGNLALALILLQQALATVAAVVMFTATEGDLVLGAFHVGARLWLLWGPALFLAAPLLLHKSPREKVAWIAAGVGGTPLVLLVLASLAWPGVLFAGGGTALQPWAALGLLWSFVAFAATVGLLVLEGVHTPMPVRRGQMFLIAAALAGEGSFHASQNVAKLVVGDDFHGLAGATAPIALLSVAPLLALLATAGWTLLVARGSRDPTLRGWIHLFAGFVLVAGATGVASAPLVSGEEFRHPSGMFHAAWDLASLCLLVFAGMRFQLFSIELRFKQGLHVSGALFLVGVAYVVVQGLLEDFVADRYLAGLPANSIVAGLAVTAASVPIERVVRRATRRVLPQVAPTEEYAEQRREDIYRAALEGALLDGAMSPREANTLRLLRQTLGLDEGAHDRIEASIRRTIVPSAPAAVALA